MDPTSLKIAATGVTIAATLLSLLGGLALVLNALGNAKLTLSLALVRDARKSRWGRGR